MDIENQQQRMTDLYSVVTNSNILNYRSKFRSIELNAIIRVWSLLPFVRKLLNNDAENKAVNVMLCNGNCFILHVHIQVKLTFKTK